jgi:hypothetical protein
MNNRRKFLKTIGITSAGFLVGSAPVLAADIRYLPDTVNESRKACYQFAMQYFHFCKSLVDILGEEKALPVVQQTVFELSLDRTDKMRARAVEQGLEPTLANFRKVSDLARSAWDGWTPSLGGVKCPYAEVWMKYFDEYTWFKRFSAHFCDVIDTTNIENFTRTTSHRITKNLLWGDEDCEREYFESDKVKQGEYTYGVRKS